MTGWIDALIVWVTAHPTLAYAAVFVLALSESIPLIGVFVPGTAVIVAVSALVPGGVIKLWPLMAAALAGAIVGDGLPFWFGHRHHGAILSRWPLVRYPTLVDRSRAFIDRHGDKSVFLARFTPGVRAFVPLFAGILRMPVGRFYAANVLSALVWAPTHILPGVLLGASFSHLGAAALPAALLLAVLVVLIWASVRTIRVLARRGTPLVLATLSRLSVRAERHDSSAGRLVARVLDPSRAETPSLLALGALLIGAAWLFLGILEDLITGDPLVHVDTTLHDALQALRTAPGDAVMIAITELGDVAVVVPVALTVLAWLAWRRAWRTARYWTVAIVGASLMSTAIKGALHRPRPGEPLYSGWSAYSFPSGHSTVNVVLYGFLAVLVAQGIGSRARGPLVLGAASIALLIAFSRLYLGVHWFSDVAGGAAFGVAWVSLLGVWWLYGRREDIAAGGLLAVAALALVLAGGTHVVRRHAADVATYAVTPTTPTLLVADWRDSAWRTLPARRTDIAGEIGEPLTIQWAGRADELARILEGIGWTQAPPWTLASATRWLGARTAPRDLPVVPALDGGRLAGLTMIEATDGGAGDERRRILRLWAADIDVVAESRVPLWQGSIVEEHLLRPASMLTLTWTSERDGAPLGALPERLPNARRLYRTDTTAAPSPASAVLLAGVGNGPPASGTSESGGP